MRSRPFEGETEAAQQAQRLEPVRSASAAQHLLALQRTAGNRAVAQLARYGKKFGPPTAREQLIEELERNPARRRLDAYIPSTKMGRFDAEYLPSKGRLMITVRPFLNYVGPWTKSQIKDFEAKFLAQTRKAWSGQYSFVCTKYGYQDLVVSPDVRAELAPDAAHAHFNITVNHTKAGDAFIARESYSNPAAISTGQFAREDAPKRPHENLKTRCTMALHEVSRMRMFLKANGVEQVSFRADDQLTAPSSVGIRNFMRALERTTLPHAAKVPLLVTGFDTATERAGGGKSRAKLRADKVKEELKPIAKQHPIRTRTISEVIAQHEQKQQEAVAGYEQGIAAGKRHQELMQEGFYKRGGTSYTQAETKIAQLKGGQSAQAVQLEPDEAWAMAYKDSDPYSILAHEFGHMLGNPDEYFGWGPEGLDNKIAQLLASGNAADAQEAIELQALRGKPNDNMNDAQRRDIQDKFTALVASAGERIPEMSMKGATATTSIMSAGGVVQRAHYVTLMEALAQITKPTLTMSDWKIL